MENQRRYKIRIIIASLLILSTILSISSDPTLTPVNSLINKQNQIEGLILESGLNSGNLLTSTTSSGEDPLKTNVFPEGGFEEAYSSGLPTGFYFSGSGYSSTNLSYGADTHSGSYAGLIEAMGEQHFGGDPYLYQNYASSLIQPNMTEKLYFDMWFNIVANTDLLSGGTVYLQLQFYNGSYYYLYYYLSYSSNYVISNDTNSYSLLMNQSFPSWHQFSRNITADFEDTLGYITPNVFLRRFYIYGISPAEATGLTQVIIDDVSLSNSSYQYITNGDFETGDGSGWSRNTNRAPSHVSLTTFDITEGNSALNMSCKSIYLDSYCNLNAYNYFSYPSGYYASEPESTIIEFDWKYNDTPNGGDYQYAYFQIMGMNETSGAYLYWYLGRNNDYNPQSNSSGGYYKYGYFNVTGFGNRNTWQHQKIELYEAFSDMNLTKISLYQIEIDIVTDNQMNSSVQLLIDNLTITTYPTGDPGFDQDWY